METARLRLRVPTIEDVPQLDAWDRSPEERGEFNDFGLPFTSHEGKAVEGTFVQENHGKLLIETVEGTPIGTVDWRPAMYGPGEESRAWQIGISLATTARGKGYGGEALRLICEYLFANTSATRIEGQTDVENVASQRALEKAGFTREGVARQSQFRAGALHDLVVYSMLRGELG